MGINLKECIKMIYEREWECTRILMAGNMKASTKWMREVEQECLFGIIKILCKVIEKA
jgi:hypothetical protein